MKVTLINYTQDAADLLIFTKQTRLEMTPGAMLGVRSMTDIEKREQLEYISNTIKSSWEFVDYTFLIEDVTRAFTHQFVRNRQGSYAQQTMRILNKSGFTYHTGPTIADNEILHSVYDEIMQDLNIEYKDMIENGAAIEDARGILPTNIHTNITAKYNLRTMSELVASRSSPRTQGEFRDVMEGMYQEIIRVHPWAVNFLKDKKHDAATALDEFVADKAETPEQQMQLTKLIDQLRK